MWNANSNQAGPFRWIHLMLGLYGFWFVVNLHGLQKFRVARPEYFFPQWSWLGFALFAGTCFCLCCGRMLLPAMLAYYGFLVWIALSFPFVKEIYFDFLGWSALFLAARLVCPGADGRTPVPLRAAFWTIFGLSYGYVGFTKLASPHWVSGEVLSRFLGWNSGKFLLSRFVLATLPMRPLSVAVAAAQISCPLFVPFRRLRPLAWVLTTLLHVGIGLSSDYYHISLAMLIYQGIAGILILEVRAETIPAVP